jgi:hypothetical protein
LVFDESDIRARFDRTARTSASARHPVVTIWYHAQSSAGRSAAAAIVKHE